MENDRLEMVKTGLGNLYDGSDLPEISQDELLTIPELAEKLGFTPKYVYELVKELKIPHFSVRKNDVGSSTRLFHCESVNWQFTLYKILKESEEAASKYLIGHQISEAVKTEEGRAKAESLFTSLRLHKGDITKEQFVQKLSADPMTAEMLSYINDKLHEQYIEWSDALDDVELKRREAIDELEEYKKMSDSKYITKYSIAEVLRGIGLNKKIRDEDEIYEQFDLDFEENYNDVLPWEDFRINKLVEGIKQQVERYYYTIRPEYNNYKDVFDKIKDFTSKTRDQNHMRLIKYDRCSYGDCENCSYLNKETEGEYECTKNRVSYDD